MFKNNNQHLISKFQVLPVPGLESSGELMPGRFLIKRRNMDYYERKEIEHEEMVGCGVITVVVLLIIAVVLSVAQAIHGWLQ